MPRLRFGLGSNLMPPTNVPDGLERPFYVRKRPMQNGLLRAMSSRCMQAEGLRALSPERTGAAGDALGHRRQTTTHFSLKGG